MNFLPTLKRLGMSAVEVTGLGFTATMVGRDGCTYLISYRHHHSVPSEAQNDFAHQWRGSPLRVVCSMDEALAAIGYRRRDMKNYHARKAAWNQQNPDATQREYLDAMAEIAQEYGL